MSRIANALVPDSLLCGNRYRIDAIIAVGGFSLIYRGFDTQLKRIVAIKEVFLEGFGRTNASPQVEWRDLNDRATQYHNLSRHCQRLQEEASTLSNLRHPHIISVYDIFEENGTAYLIMEYLKGYSLYQYTLNNENGRLPLDEAISFITVVGETLAYFHQNTMDLKTAKCRIHCDVTPNNIIRLSDGTVKLIDFGSARYVTPNKSESLSVSHTTGFGAPEQYRRKGIRGPYTDVYGLAATLWFLLSGDSPQDGFIRRSHDNNPTIQSLRPEVSSQLSEVIRQGMMVNYHERPQTMEQFIRLVQDATFNNTFYVRLASSPLINYARAQEEENNGKLKEAVQCYNAVIANSQSSPYLRLKSYYGRGRIERKRGDLFTAQNDLEKCLKLHIEVSHLPGAKKYLALSHLLLGHIKGQCGDLDTAAMHYDHALSYMALPEKEQRQAQSKLKLIQEKISFKI